ncbi:MULTISPECIES: winged helix-turn-helix transcriptional regulator [Bacteroides]|jgi:putative transcriptional regulator|uniref:winged helix-turn-helix transcriptional regulator n=1 Tax=Bacteroides TaxID=816 RepID=UPI00164CC11C|nr:MULTISPECIES: winged helix-turn-helix transcriptional regulator [Bacteroides]MBC5586789.1 winged helix-turn-helix transcriptional regulator [Bacteroides sp. NSJ-39]
MEEPVFKQSEGGMLITFKRNYPTMTNEKSHSRANDPINDPIKLSSVDINVLHILSTNTKLTYNTLAEALSSSSATAKRSLQNLKAYGYITRQGSNKAGYWQLTEKGKIFIIKEQRL